MCSHLHAGAAAQSEDEVKGGLLLNVVIAECPPVLELLAREDEPLLLGRNSFLVLDLRLDVLNRVVGLDIEGYRFAGESLDKAV